MKIVDALLLLMPSRKDMNLVLSRVARFYATTEQKFIHSFWNAVRIRRKITPKFVLYIVYILYYTKQSLDLPI